MTTSATDPFPFAHHLHPGVHITAEGADMVGKRELAADVITRADVIAVDDRGRGLQRNGSETDEYERSFEHYA
jgi:ornithine cyclodeaminase/alanine dehydrogenase-like protein (mu-crystallin family)